MAKLDTQAGIDWTACELIEQIPGKVSGRPIVRGTYEHNLADRTTAIGLCPLLNGTSSSTTCR
jgi:hypothetical protein